MSHPRHHQADVVLRDGSTVHVRPIRATDAPTVHAFFERLSAKSITLRFFSSFPDLDRAVQQLDFVYTPSRDGPGRPTESRCIT